MIFRFPGGKSRVAKLILSKAPSVIKDYREPFCGGSSVFFAIQPINRWINDIDPHLMSVYLALRDRPTEFIEMCKKIKPQKQGEKLTSARPGGKKIYNARLKSVFDKLSFDDKCDQALRYLFVNKTVFAGRTNYDMPSRMYFSNPSGWNIVKGNKLEKAAEHLKDVNITVGSYEQLLSTPGEDVWIYADPPYLVNTNLARSSQLYRYGFMLEDHEKFRDAVYKCKHKILISYDDDEGGVIRKLFSNFNIESASWTYCGTSSAKNQSKTKKKGKELFITNY